MPTLLCFLASTTIDQINSSSRRQIASTIMPRNDACNTIVQNDAFIFDLASSKDLSTSILHPSNLALISLVHVKGTKLDHVRTSNHNTTLRFDNGILHLRGMLIIVPSDENHATMYRGIRSTMPHRSSAPCQLDLVNLQFASSLF